jgi:uncharacterized protein YpbB
MKGGVVYNFLVSSNISVFLFNWSEHAILHIQVLGRQATKHMNVDFWSVQFFFVSVFHQFVLKNSECSAK